MPEKVIALEELEGPFQQILQRVMRLVPDQDQNDTKLQRLIAFRHLHSNLGFYMLNKVFNGY